MRNVSADTDAIWLSGDYTGANRPICRATISRPQMDLFDLGYNVYAAYMFGKNATQPRELPNIKSLKWTRGVDTDVATATMELYNTVPQPPGTAFDPSMGFDQPGYYSFAGVVATPTSDQQAWQSLLVPDNLVRTYEGYGCEPSLGPENDPNLYPSGVWIIKDVEFLVTGLIVLQMEDLASILRDQIAFYPVVPPKFYPLQFSSVPKVSGFTQGQVVTKLVDSGGNYDPNYPPPDGWTGPTRAPTNVAANTSGNQVVISWLDVPKSSVPDGYEITGYQIVIDNVRQWLVIGPGRQGQTFFGAPFVPGNVYWVTVVAVYARLSDGYEQISNHSAGVFVHPHTDGFTGAVSNIAINDVPA